MLSACCTRSISNPPAGSRLFILLSLPPAGPHVPAPCQAGGAVARVAWAPIDEDGVGHHSMTMSRALLLGKRQPGTESIRLCMHQDPCGGWIAMLDRRLQQLIDINMRILFRTLSRMIFFSSNKVHNVCVMLPVKQDVERFSKWRDPLYKPCIRREKSRTRIKSMFPSTLPDAHANGPRPLPHTPSSGQPGGRDWKKEPHRLAPPPHPPPRSQGTRSMRRNRGGQHRVQRAPPPPKNDAKDDGGRSASRRERRRRRRGGQEFLGGWAAERHRRHR